MAIIKQKHAVICSDSAICYCSILINLTGSVINLQYQIGAIVYIDLLMLLISFGGEKKDKQFRTDLLTFEFAYI